MTFRRRPPILEDFVIMGAVDGVAVRAVWDGNALVVSERLYRRALLAVAVDTAFAEAGLWPHRHCPTLEGPPADVALTLVRSCDDVDAVEYTHCGRRRATPF